jgi:hypothetical protein
VRVADHANFRFSHGTLATSKIVPAVVSAHVSSVVTNEGGLLAGSLSRLHLAIEKAPSVALALSSCNYTCSRTGDLWEPLPGALARIRLLRAAERELVFTPIKDVTPAQLNSLREGLIGSVQIEHEDPQDLAISVSSPEDAVLVVADLYYPGWQCTVDGQPVTIEPAHGVFRAVSLSQGNHRVEFHFRSASFRWGAWCSLAGLAIVAGMAVVGNPKSKI